MFTPPRATRDHVPSRSRPYADPIPIIYRANPHIARINKSSHAFFASKPNRLVTLNLGVFISFK